MAGSDLNPATFQFDNGKQAGYLKVSPVTPAAEIVAAFAMRPPTAVMTIIGGAQGLEEKMLPHLSDLFSRGVARAAFERRCLVITGGTDYGVMQLMGQGIADRGRSAPAVGVVPAGLVRLPGSDDRDQDQKARLEPHHSHFVLVDGVEWGAETDTMYRLTRHLADGVPSISILCGGGDTARKELLYTIRQKRPVIVLEGSGRLADDVAMYWRAFHDQLETQYAQSQSEMITTMQLEPFMAEIVEEGHIILCPHTNTAGGLHGLIHQHLPQTVIDDTTTLQEAWQQFANYDLEATRKSDQFHRIRRAVLWAGLMAVTFAVLSTVVTEEGMVGLLAYFGLTEIDAQSWWINRFVWLLHAIALILPATSAVILAGANRFHPGENWRALRAAAEDVQKEIYRYRARVAPYDEQNALHKLADYLDMIGHRIMRGNVKEHDLRPYQGPLPPKQLLAEGDDGFQPLSGDDYLQYRLQLRLNYYETRTPALYRNLKNWQWIIYAAGGVGTVLGFLHLDAFIAITASVATGLGSYMEMLQVEAMLRSYNQTAQVLRNIRTRWRGDQAILTSVSQLRRAFDSMVAATEDALITERAGWIEEAGRQQAGEGENQVETAPPTV